MSSSQESLPLKGRPHPVRGIETAVAKRRAEAGGGVYGLADGVGVAGWTSPAGTGASVESTGSGRASALLK